MATHKVPWGTYKEIDIALKLPNTDVPPVYTPVVFLPSEMEMYLYAKKDLADDDAEAIFRLSTHEGTIVMNPATTGPNIGKGIGKIYPPDTTSLKPSEKTELQYEIKLIHEVSPTDIRPYQTEIGKIIVSVSVVQKVENSSDV